MNQAIFILIYFALVIPSIMIMNSSNNVITIFLGYNLLVIPIGLLLAIVLPNYNLNDIAFAFMEASAVTIIMLLVANIKPQLV